MNPRDIHQIIRRDYATIARLAAEQGREWWRAQVCLPIFEPIAAEYPLQPGYIEAANLALGCAFPVALSDIQAGDTVVDLGCAAGLDSFIAAHRVGAGGRVIGLDLTPDLIAVAGHIAIQNGISQAQFQVADAEKIPLPDATADAIISNGVFSLLPDRVRVFQEMYRVLRPGGHFLITDLCAIQPLPDDLHEALRQFTGCLNGIAPHADYEEQAAQAGFQDLHLRQSRPVILPADLCKRYPQHAEILAGNGPLHAIGLFGRKKA